MSDNDKKNSKGIKNTSHEQTARLRIIKNEDIEAYRKSRKKKRGYKDFLKEKSPVNSFFRKPMKTSTKYRRKYLILSLIVVFIFIIAYQFIKVQDIDFQKLSSKIESKVDSNKFKKGDFTTLRRLYGINKNEIDSFVSFAPKSNMMASEILILKSKDENVKSIIEKIQSRIDSQSESFRNYAKNQYEIIANCELKQKGDYIYFISWPNKDEINNLIKECYK